MLVLDAGAFIAAERSSKDMPALVKRERERGRTLITNGSCHRPSLVRGQRH